MESIPFSYLEVKRDFFWGHSFSSKHLGGLLHFFRFQKQWLLKILAHCFFLKTSRIWKFDFGQTPWKKWSNIWKIQKLLLRVLMKTNLCPLCPNSCPTNSLWFLTLSIIKFSVEKYDKYDFDIFNPKNIDLICSLNF